MITKPVSKIFNVESLVTSGSGESVLKNLSKGGLVIMDKSMSVIDPNSGSYASQDFDIYYKDKKGYVHKQPGTNHFRANDIHNINAKKATDGEPFVAVIKDYKYCCDGEYGFRFVVHNDEMDKLFWPNGYYETYMVPIDECCAACGGSTTESDDVITIGLYNAIKANEDSWLEPSIIVVAQGDSTPTYTTGMIVEPSDVSAITTEGGKTGLLIKIKDAEAWPYAQYNFKYTHIRSSKFEVGKIAGAKCSVNVVSNTDENFSISYTPLKLEDSNATITVYDTTKGKFTPATVAHYSSTGYLYVDGKRYAYTKSSSDIVITDGAALAGTKDVYIYASAVSVNRFSLPQTWGYDLKQVEYQLMGYRENMSPYRLSDVTMTEFGYTYSFDDDKKYDVLTVSYEKYSDAATVHMPYPMSVIFTFYRDGSTISGYADKIAKFFGIADGSSHIQDINKNLK